MKTRRRLIRAIQITGPLCIAIWLIVLVQVLTYRAP